MDTAEVVLRFLESVGRRSESEFYLALFRAAPKERFAAISVDANVARHATEAVVLDLRFLSALGLAPVVVLGLFEPTDAPEHAARIVRRLERAGVPARILPAEEAGLDEGAAQAARAGILPVVVFSQGAKAEAEVDARFQRVGALLAQLVTRKLIFLHRPGGLRRAGELVPLVNLTTEFEELMAARDLSRKEHAILAHSRRLIFERVPHKLVVAVTSPLNLFRELFTVKGAGTLLRRGAVIGRRALDEIDHARLAALLSSAFGRPPREELFTRPISRVYVDEAYRGAALVVETPLGAYLTKFAVEREAQGEGMGRDLWQLLAADHTTLFWRARVANPICEWYEKQCSGLMRFPEWNVYWRGLAPERIPAAIEYALAQPVDIPQSAIE